MLSATWSAPAQVISIDTHRQQGKKKVEVPTRGLAGFSFHEFDTTLTDTARLYLDVFAQHYRDSLFPDRQYAIELTNSMTDIEQERDSSLWYKRAMAIIHYLNANCGIEAQNFRGRCLQTSTRIAQALLVLKGRQEG